MLAWQHVLETSRPCLWVTCNAFTQDKQRWATEHSVVPRLVDNLHEQTAAVRDAEALVSTCQQALAQVNNNVENCQAALNVRRFMLCCLALDVLRQTHLLYLHAQPQQLGGVVEGL